MVVGVSGAGATRWAAARADPARAAATFPAVEDVRARRATTARATWRAGDGGRPAATAPGTSVA